MSKCENIVNQILNNMDIDGKKRIVQWTSVRWQIVPTGALSNN